MMARLAGLAASPAFVAAAQGDEDAFAQVATRDNVNAKDMRGDTALIVASTLGATEIVKHALSLGADANIRGNNNKNALHR
jgi:ankyrin repeat protein